MATVQLSSCFFLTPDTIKRSSGSVVRLVNEKTGVESFGILVYEGGSVIANVGTFANVPSAIDDAERYGLFLWYPERAQNAAPYQGGPFLDPEDFGYLPPTHWRNQQPPRTMDVPDAAQILPELGKALARGLSSFVRTLKGG